MRRAARTDRPAAFNAVALAAPVAALAAALVAGLVAGCAPRPGPDDRARLIPVSFAALDGWADDAPAAAAAMLARHCARRSATRPEPATTPLADAPLIGAPAWDAACAAASALPPADAPDATEAARAFFARWFRPHHLGDGDGLMTGYYEPEVRGALAPDARFRVALHARPPELVDVDLGQFRDGWRAERVAGRVVDGRLAPMPARAAIETGALAGRGLELVWLDDAVDAFFLHIQGSGRVRLPDGSLRRIGYAGANGHRYTAIGRVIADESALAPSQVSMQSIRAWLAAHPDRAAEVMRRNASYVFFRWRDGDGPVGTAGTTLVAGRSLAVDPRFVPLGAPVWVETMVDGRPFRRLMIAEDTGGAIRGAGRGDIFIGGGEAAGETAGRLRATGRLTVLLPAP